MTMGSPMKPAPDFIPREDHPDWKGYEPVELPFPKHESIMVGGTLEELRTKAKEYIKQCVARKYAQCMCSSNGGGPEQQGEVRYIVDTWYPAWQLEAFEGQQCYWADFYAMVDALIQATVTPEHSH